MDIEFPRTPESINNRTALARELRMNKLLNRNRDQDLPFRTMIEVMVLYTKNKLNTKARKSHGHDASTLEEIVPQFNVVYARKDTIPRPWNIKLKAETNLIRENRNASFFDVNDNNLTFAYSEENKRLNNTHHAPLTELAGRSNCNSKEWRSGSEPPSPTRDPLSPQQMKHIRSFQELGLEVSDGQDNALRVKEKILLSSLCASTDWRTQDNKLRLGPNIYNVFECLQKPVEESREERTDSEQEEVRTESHLHSDLAISDKMKAVSSSKHKNAQEHDPESSQGVVEVHSSLKLSENTEVNMLETNQKDDSDSKFQNERSERVIRLNSVPKDNKSDEIPSLNESKCSNDSNQQETLQMPGLKDAEESLELDTGFESLKKTEGNMTISLLTAIELKKVILGSASANFSAQWLGQGFTFNTHHNLRYGFVQKKGGSCGVLATVQAFLLKILLFEEGACNCTEPVRPTGTEARSALVRALGDVLWRAGLGESSALVL